jgi:hypothetical protein
MKYRILGNMGLRGERCCCWRRKHGGGATGPAPPALPADPEASRAQAEARMRDAEQRLQEAAREIAELTSGWSANPAWSSSGNWPAARGA